MLPPSLSQRVRMIEVDGFDVFQSNFRRAREFESSCEEVVEVRVVTGEVNNFGGGPN